MTPTTGCALTPDKCPNLVRIQELEKRMDIQMQANKQAVELAADDLREWLMRMNEFRDALKDQAATFITRPEYEEKHRVLERDISHLNEFQAELRGKASQASVNVALAIALLGTVGSLIDWIRHGVTP